MDVLPVSLRSELRDADEEETASDQARPSLSEFASLYEQHLPRIYRYVRSRTSSDEDATDLTHQTFLKALDALQRYRQGRTPFIVWLYRIARNVVIDFHRRDRGTVSWDAIPESMQPVVMDVVETAVLDKERAERLQDLLAGMSAERREVLALRFGSGLKVREIAAILDRSEAAVKAELRRTLQALRERYDDD